MIIIIILFAQKAICQSSEQSWYWLCSTQSSPPDDDGDEVTRELPFYCSILAEDFEGHRLVQGHSWSLKLLASNL